MPWMSSGLVSMRTSTTLRPLAFISSASSDENTISPVAAPGDAGRPDPMMSRSAFGSMVGCSSWSSEAGSTRAIASSREIRPSLRHLDGDADRRLGGALARACLQHPQLAALDGELEVLHVAVVLFQAVADADKSGEGVRHQLLQRRLVGAGIDAGGFGDVLRRADAGHDVLALGVDQELAIEQLFAGRRVAGEGDAGGRGLAHIAEHHGLHVDGRAPAFGNVVQAAVGDGARVHPARKHRADRAPQLLVRVLRKRLAELFLDLGLVEPDHMPPLVGREFGVELEPEPAFLVLQDFFENLVVEAEHDVAVHLDEAAVAVIGKARIAGILAPAPRPSRH